MQLFRLWSCSLEWSPRKLELPTPLVFVKKKTCQQMVYKVTLFAMFVLNSFSKILDEKKTSLKGYTDRLNLHVRKL